MVIAHRHGHGLLHAMHVAIGNSCSHALRPCALWLWRFMQHCVVLYALRSLHSLCLHAPTHLELDCGHVAWHLHTLRHQVSDLGAAPEASGLHLLMTTREHAPTHLEAAWRCFWIYMPCGLESASAPEPCTSIHLHTLRPHGLHLLTLRPYCVYMSFPLYIALHVTPPLHLHTLRP